jgi:hypothetical protein
VDLLRTDFYFDGILTEAMEPTPHSFEDLLNLVHKEGVMLFDYDNMKIPCLVLKGERFKEIAKAFYGKPLVVDSNLNIMHDDKKHVFVEIVLKFTSVDTEEKVLLYANENMEFFEHLAESAIIGLVPVSIEGQEARILMVQLPRRETLEDALEMIKSYLK